MAEGTPLSPEERDLLAAELALGVLEGDARGQALRLQLSDAEFRAAVSAWQARLEPLLHGYGEVEAPDLWNAIDQRLAGDAGDANEDVSRIEGRMRSWRIGALMAGAVAAALALLLVQPRGPVSTPTSNSQIAQTSPPVVARLGESDGPAQFVADYDAAHGELLVRTIRLAKSDLAPELWIIPADNVPRSLGLIAPSGTRRVTVAPALRSLLRDGATLAVTMEKREGAPHAAPGSAPVAAGQIHEI